MVKFLQEDSERGAAFAAVEGITPAAISDYMTALTPVTLRTDTAVTNHGFANGNVTPFQAVLQAGTAVMGLNRPGSDGGPVYGIATLMWSSRWAA
jgi:hypothetical protein